MDDPQEIESFLVHLCDLAAAETLPRFRSANRISNKLDDGPGKPIADGGVGYSCIAEIRMIETIESGKPTTPFMQFGDRIRIEMRDAEGRSVFGLIDQRVEKYEGP